MPWGGRPSLPTGVAALDAAIGGGLPCGRVTELAGRSGTSLACAVAARVTRTGGVVGWVDPTDAFDPDTAARTGLLLPRVLWVRPRTEHDAPRAAEWLLGAGGFGLVVLDLAEAAPPSIPWPRLERAAERTRTALLVLGRARRAHAHAALALELTTRRACWSHGPGRPALLDAVVARLAVARTRTAVPGRTLTVRQACA
jgi:hypothetical protein